MFRIIYKDEHPHRGCQGNLEHALAEHGITPDRISIAFNVFMNVDVNGTTGEIRVPYPPLSKPGQSTSFPCGDGSDRGADGLFTRPVEQFHVQMNSFTGWSDGRWRRDRNACCTRGAASTRPELVLRPQIPLERQRHRPQNGRAHITLKN